VVTCGKCNEIFHGKCVGVSKREINSKEKYICPFCDLEKPLIYFTKRPTLPAVRELVIQGEALSVRIDEIKILKEVISNVEVYLMRVGHAISGKFNSKLISQLIQAGKALEIETGQLPLLMQKEKESLAHDWKDRVRLVMTTAASDQVKLVNELLKESHAYTGIEEQVAELQDFLKIDQILKWKKKAVTLLGDKKGEVKQLKEIVRKGKTLGIEPNILQTIQAEIAQREVQQSKANLEIETNHPTSSTNSHSNNAPLPITAPKLPVFLNNRATTPSASSLPSKHALTPVSISIPVSNPSNPSSVLKIEPRINLQKFPSGFLEGHLQVHPHIQIPIKSFSSDSPTIKQKLMENKSQSSPLPQDKGINPPTSLSTSMVGAAPKANHSNSIAAHIPAKPPSLSPKKQPKGGNTSQNGVNSNPSSPKKEKTAKSKDSSAQQHFQQQYQQQLQMQLKQQQMLIQQQLQIQQQIQQQPQPNHQHQQHNHLQQQLLQQQLHQQLQQIQQSQQAKAPRPQKSTAQNQEIVDVDGDTDNQNEGMENGNGGGQVYCICRRADEDLAMICCDECQEWYHMQCVNVDEERAEELEKYICPLCCDRKHITYPFGLRPTKTVKKGQKKTKPALTMDDMQSN